MPMFDPTLLPEHASPHLLLVDDDPDQLRLLVEFLRGTSYRLSLAFNGSQGYDRALTLLPDLVVLDARMPGMDGFALCRRLKANSSTAHIPIIFLSSASDLEQKLQGFEGGAVDYIVKPYTAEEVVARVRIHLQLAGKLPLPTEPAGALPKDDTEVLTLAAKRELQRQPGLTPKQLAASLGVSERRLSRAFRNSEGATLFEYVRKQRMERAQALLAETALSIVTVSQELGFSSAANFSTAFREYVGAAPSDYRRAARSAIEKGK